MRSRLVGPPGLSLGGAARGPAAGWPTARGGVYMMSTVGGDVAVAELEAAIKAQGEAVRRLKAAEDKDKEAIERAVAQLLALKAKLPAGAPPPATAPPPPPAAAKQGGSGSLKKEGSESDSGGGASRPKKKGGGGGGEEALDLSDDELFQRRLQKAGSLAAAGQVPYAYGYSRTHLSDAFAVEFKDLAAGEVNEKAKVSCVCVRKGGRGG
jgi:hypothetical protein